ncbi:MAG: hypothetical protein AB3N63_16450 [Puniceicoccaceae bacterium]
MKRLTSVYAGVVWKIGLVALLILLLGNPLKGEISLVRLPAIEGGDRSVAAYGVSDDGSVIVGASYAAVGSEACVWNDGVATGLGDLPGGLDLSIAHGVSGDGQIIVGYGYSGAGRQAIRWDSEGSVTLGGVESGGLAVTDDDVIVGFETNWNSKFHARRWISRIPGGLGDLANGNGRSYATGINPSGEVIVGWASQGSGQVAFKYVEGTMTALPDLEGTSIAGWATDVSDDGTLIVGRGWGASGEEACYWLNDVIHPLGDLPEIPAASEAKAVSGDGSIIVGWGNENYWRRAVMWRQVDGYVPVKLDKFLDDSGVDRGGFSMQEAYGISSDGRVIVGMGALEGGSQEAFALYLGEGAAMWGPYVITDGWVDTGAWMGPLYVDYAPWVWSHTLGDWIFIPEDMIGEAGSWIFLSL